MGMLDDKTIESTIAELRRHRALLDELNAAYKRVRTERHARVAGYDELVKAMRDNPSRETALAYVAYCDDVHGLKVYEREEQAEKRRRDVREAMHTLFKGLHEQLGVALTVADWEHP
jgi:hypothetical protein